MAWATLDGAFLFLVALLLPIRLFTLVSRRLLRLKGPGRSEAARSAVLLASIAILLTAIFVLSDTSPSARRALVSELKDLRLKTARLEVTLEESTKTFKSKTINVEENDRMIKEMDEKIQLLQNSLHETKVSMGYFSNTEDLVLALEKEVQLLQEQSMKNNGNIKSLKSSADKATKKIEVATSKVEKMGRIVTEQWIQIRQLEQAFQTTKMMTAKVLKKGRQKGVPRNRKPSESTVNKVIQFIKGIGQFHSPQWNLPDSFYLAASYSRSAMCQAYEQIKVLATLARSCHNELQGLIEHEMQTHELTASLANNRVANFLASATMAIFTIIAWNILSSCFRLSNREIYSAK